MTDLIIVVITNLYFTTTLAKRYAAKKRHAFK